ncbi:hypothetical protein CJF30_00005389 [Rutstroemia sp. NJR-2017a BBW]|nr:hypothetical protein CJF30_00005389 [Rutstroemia sp. NJR-2017a BBW]
MVRGALALFFVRGSSDGRKRDLYKDAFAPQPTGKPLKAWDRAPVTAHAPRLHGQKIWKKRGGLRARGEGEGEEGKGYNDAVVELEKEGVGARKKARVLGAAAKENISAARWQDVNSKDGEDDAMMGASGAEEEDECECDDYAEETVEADDVEWAGAEYGGDVRGDGEGVKEEVGKRRGSVAVPEKGVGSPKKGELERTVKRQSLRRSTRGRGSGQGVTQPVEEEPVVQKAADEQPITLPDEQQVSEDVQLKDATPEPSLTGTSEHEGVASSLLSTAPEVTQSEVSAAEYVEPQHDVLTAQQSQSTGKEVAIEDEFALKPVTSVKQKRSSLRKSTRQSDRLRGSSGSIDTLTELQPSESVGNNSFTTSTAEAKVEAPQEAAAPAVTIDKESNDTLTFTIDFDLGQEKANGIPLADAAAAADMATPVQEVNHVMEELLAQPISPTKLSDEEKSDGYTGSHSNDGEMLDSPFTHVSDAEDSDEDMDDEMSELSEILLEPTINVDSLGLSGLKSSSELEMEDDQESDEADAMEDFESLEPVTVADLNVSALLSNSATTEKVNETSAQTTTDSELPTNQSSAMGSSSYMTDDTDLLREFLTRVKADKAAKAAAPPKRRSLPHSPLRIPLGDNIDIEPSSPIPEPEHEPASTKDDFNLSTPGPSTSSPTRKRKSKPTPLPSSLTTPEPQSSTRRSGRTRLPVSKVPLPAPSFIPVRRLGGQDGDPQVALKRSADKELAALTRVNTRKNKAGAVSAAEVLARKMEEKEDPVLRQRYLREVFEEKVRKERKMKEGGEEGARGRKSVMWREEIAEYKVMETRKVRTMESRVVDGEGEGQKAGRKGKKGEGKEVREKEKKNRVKVDVGGRTSKIALGVPANGTPVAKKKRAART